MINRRIFLKDGAFAVMGLSMVPGFVYRTALAAQPQLRKKTLVTVFQRGGVDGLNMVIPFGEKHYYDFRPTIAVPAPSKERPAAIDLDGFFGGRILHPSPANPRAQRDWAGTVKRELRRQGVCASGPNQHKPIPKERKR